ncbi:hypothetical protein [Methanoculleus sp.]|uniref:hypothetical protein n=1 Tax=Methanoculleus sp. TaxID=90427 RepID=UPI0025CF5424|nr:hypothetical protein [Methanoculleus sp.]
MIGTIIALIVMGAIIASIPVLKDAGEAIVALGVLGFACLIAGMIIDATSGIA